MTNFGDFLALAQAWVQGATEAEWRCAVSRAYYAAFHAAKHLLEALGFAVPRAAQAHAYLWMRLSNCGDATLQATGADLSLLQGVRNSADYDLHRPFSHSQATAAVQRASGVIHALASGHLAPLRTQMRDDERQVLRQVTWQGP